ncbi:hypothetical protein HK097_005782 [Rhizophlyctis rosea]|uniref:OsmC-like protein n=1 Tax=Rhizophlyctis rosea TaxID=64517 RepID=A0AAD5WW35_9FUNG|nr:hypothetical protein HK097_005782 [Rhizophlyctis rosea]
MLVMYLLTRAAPLLPLLLTARPVLRSSQQTIPILTRQSSSINTQPTFAPNRPTNKVEVTWAGNDSLQFLGKDASGNEVLMSASKEPGAGPMSLLLMGLGGCSSVDLVTILKKQRQNLKCITIRVEGQRGETLPRPYETIHMTFVVSGKALDKKKVREDMFADDVDAAIALAAEKYCGVHGTLSGVAKITFGSEIVEVE